jgi:hypothetical protein
MSVFERLSVPGFTEFAECRCGKKMRIASIGPLPDRSDTHIASTIVLRATMKCGLLFGVPMP